MARQEDEALERLLTRTLQSQRAANGGVCPSAEDVAAYLDRLLDAEEARRIELHLSSCARCAETLATLVESEPVPSPATPSPSPSWWSWGVWRWAAPAAAVVVIGVWFASTLPGGPEPATQMAQYDQTNEQPNAEAAAPSREAGEPAPADPAAAEKSATESVAVDKLSRRREAVTTPPRETEQRTVDSTQSSSSSAARATAEADSATPSAPTPAQPSPAAPPAQAKAEDSRTDAAPAETRREGREGAIAGFAAPAAQPASPGAPAASPPAPPPAAPPSAPPAPEAATAAATAAPAATGAARAPGGAGGRAAGREAAAPPATLAQAAEVQERAANAAGFAPLVLRTRSGNVLWRIAGSVIERSADNGTTWTQDYRAAGTISAGVVAADDTVWLAGAAGLVLQRPPAGTWRVVPPPVMEDLTGASEPGPTSITVRTASGRQYRTTNNGATWMAR